MDINRHLNSVNRSPPSPSSVIRDRIRGLTGITQSALAKAIGISPPRLNMILHGKLPITPEIALRLEKVLGISSEYLIQLRSDFDLFAAKHKLRAELDELQQLQPQFFPEPQQIAA